MKCPNCGKTYDTCIECGAKLISDKEENHKTVIRLEQEEQKLINKNTIESHEELLLGLEIEIELLKYDIYKKEKYIKLLKKEIQKDFCRFKEMKSEIKRLEEELKEYKN